MSKFTTFYSMWTRSEHLSPNVADLIYFVLILNLTTSTAQEQNNAEAKANVCNS